MRVAVIGSGGAGLAAFMAATPHLGLVATSRRSIKSGSEYNQYFDLTEVEGKEVALIDGSVYDTLTEMRKIVQHTLHQTKKISKKLEGSSREATCRNIWNFLYNHIQYKKDNPSREQLRTPIRSWRDRASGIDCDCYSIFISSILTNLGIAHSFRMAAYSGDYQHVYVVVPNGAKNIVIDPVIDQFNKEQPFTKKHDNKMGKAMLNGPDKDRCKPVSVRTIRRYVPTEQIFASGLLPTREFLESKNIPFQEVVSDRTDGGVFVINTLKGLQQIPTVLTPAQADQVLKAALLDWCARPTLPDTDTQPKPGEVKPGKSIPWFWIALGGAALFLMSGSENQPVKSGLAGVPVVKQERSKPKRKVKAISI